MHSPKDSLKCFRKITESSIVCGKEKMLTSKQRAALRAMANGIDPIMQIGKGGISDNLIKTVSDALEAKELIKMKVLENSAESAKSAAEELACATNSDVVCVVGTKFVLYRQSSKEKNRKIVLS